MSDAIWVKWIDSNHQRGWCDDDDIKSLRPAVFLEIGFIAREEADYIILSPTTLAVEVEGQSPYREPIAIPKCAILERGVVDIVPHQVLEMSGA